MLPPPPSSWESRVVGSTPKYQPTSRITTRPNPPTLTPPPPIRPPPPRPPPNPPPAPRRSSMLLLRRPPRQSMAVPPSLHPRNTARARMVAQARDRRALPPYDARCSLRYAIRDHRSSFPGVLN